MLDRSQDHPGLRAELASALLDAGRLDEARSLLDSRPLPPDDPTALRLLARLDLDLDARPDRAAEALGRLLEPLPHDWRTRAMLSRALQALGDPEEARRQALLVDRHREQLEPSRLGPMLAEALSPPEDPTALADLCDAVGLRRLANAWRREARSPSDAR